jgi:hypothetical protein
VIGSVSPSQERWPAFESLLLLWWIVIASIAGEALERLM